MTEEKEYYYCYVIRDVVGGIEYYQFQHPHAVSDSFGKHWSYLTDAPGIVGFAGIEFEDHPDSWWGQVSMWQDFDEEGEWMSISQHPSNYISSTEQKQLIPNRVRFLRVRFLK